MDGMGWECIPVGLCPPVTACRPLPPHSGAARLGWRQRERSWHGWDVTRWAGMYADRRLSREGSTRMGRILSFSPALVNVAAASRSIRRSYIHHTCDAYTRDLGTGKSTSAYSIS